MTPRTRFFPPTTSERTTGVFPTLERRDFGVGWFATLAVSALAMGCGPDPETATFVVMPFPVSILVCVGCCIGCYLAGTATGFALALQFLRLADSASRQYHSHMVATVLEASSDVHALFNDIVATATDRIVALRRELRRLKEAQS